MLVVVIVDDFVAVNMMSDEQRVNVKGKKK